MHLRILTVGFCFLLSAPGWAQEGASNRSMDEMLRSADTIFKGTVVRVEHRASEIDADSPAPIPHTFVTYAVDEVLKGGVEGAEVTLRFFGGPIDEKSFLMLPHSPLFDAGDSDLLLVKDHLHAWCPLVSCPDARFRFLADTVVSELGQQIVLDPDGRTLRYGPALELDAISKHRMSDSIALVRDEFSELGPAARPGFEQLEGIDPAEKLTGSEFVDRVARAIRRSHTDEELAAARANPLRSADPWQPFHATPVEIVGPPQRRHPVEEPLSARGMRTSPGDSAVSVQARPELARRDRTPPPDPALPSAKPTEGQGWIGLLAVVLGLLGLAVVLRRARFRRSERGPSRTLP